MSEETPCKRIKLGEDDATSLTKQDLLDTIKRQEEVIAELETKLESASSSSSADGEDKTRHLKAARREQLLVMRLTTKEQELHELANQLADKNQNASTAHLRAALVDPALNLLVQRLKKELEDKSKGLDQAREDMAAWKFTQDSQTGKRLMARCRTLIQENQELGKQVSQGKIAQVEAELALQKEINEELKNSQDEMYEMVLQLNDEGEGMQSTILALQQELKEKQLELARLRGEGESSDGIPESLTLPSSAAGALVKNEPETNIPMEQDREAEGQMNSEQRVIHDEQPNAEDVQPQVLINAQSPSTTDVQSNVIGEQDLREPCAEPEPEQMEHEETTTEKREEPQYPEVRTTEYFDETEPSEQREEPVHIDHYVSTANKDSLSVEPWTNPSHYVESPASPEMEEDERTSEGVREEEISLRTEVSYKSPLQEICYAEKRDVPPAHYRESPERTRDSMERTRDFNMPETRYAGSSGEERDDGSKDSRDFTEKEQQAELQEEQGDGFREELQFRTTPDESSQDSTLSGGNNRDVDSDDSSRSEELVILTPDISTNGENHADSVTDVASNNGEAQQFVNSDCGREGDGDAGPSNKNSLNTLVEDPSTFKSVVEGESNSLDNGSDVTDRQSEDTAPDNNNGLSNPQQCINSGLSSPLEDEVPLVVDDDFGRTDTVIKSVNANSHQENSVVGEGSRSEQCDSEDDTVLQNSVPSSNQEEISV